MNINKKKLGIIGAISIISVILISVFIFTQIGPYDKNNKKGIVVEIPQGATTSTISDILYKNKLIKGKELGGEVVYIKEDNLLYGIESIYKNHEVNSISLLKSEQNSIKVHDLIEFLERECDDFYEGDVFIGNTIHSREDKKGIVSVEFAQYEAIKMIFINI